MEFTSFMKRAKMPTAVIALFESEHTRKVIFVRGSVIITFWENGSVSVPLRNQLLMTVAFFERISGVPFSIRKATIIRWYGNLISRREEIASNTSTCEILM